MDKFEEKPWCFANLELIILGAKAYDLASFWDKKIRGKLWILGGAGSQMVVASLSGEDDRAGALARLGVSYGFGKQILRCLVCSFHCS